MQSGNANQPEVELSSQIQAKIKEAELYLSQGLFDEARQVYRDLLDELEGTYKKDAGVPEARRVLQEQLVLIDRQEAKFYGLADAPEQEKTEPAQEGEGAALYDSGLALLEAELFAEAVQEFRLAADMGYKPIECSLQIGRAHLQQGQHREAVKVLEGALQLPQIANTDRNRLLEQLASAYEADDDKGRALKIYQQLAEADPHHPTALSKMNSLGTTSKRYHLNLARLHLKNRQSQKTIQQLRLLRSQFQVPAAELLPIYRELLQADPENTDILKDLAEVTVAQGDLAQAVDYLEKLQEIQPQDAWSEKQLASVYKQLAESVTVDPEARLKLARHHLQEGDFESAVSEYLEVILEETPHKLSALNQLGDALLERQDYDRILELLGDALPWVESYEQGTETLRYYCLMGNACENKDLSEQARAYFERAAAIDPQHEAVRDKVAAQISGPLISQGKSLAALKVDESRQYEIQKKIGQDEIHQFFKVREIPSGKIRTAKTLLPHLAENPKVEDFVRRWACEQAAMENRNIVRVLDVAESQGRYYVIVEDYECTLEELLAEEKSLSLRAAVHMARALLNALAYAHSHRGTDEVLRKIFHLSLNPRRVLIKGDTANAKIDDLGLSFLLDSILDWRVDFRERSPAELAHMAPEQFDRSSARMPDKMKQAADIYAFGVVFYRALTGALPFAGPSPEEFRKQHSEKYPVPPRVFISSIPAKLDELVLRCLHKDPKKRWRTPTELDLALEKISLSE